MENLNRPRQFILAGKAIFTIENEDSGNRFTFKVSKVKDGDVYFVNVLNGPDNYNSYIYLGIIDQYGKFKRTAKSKTSEKALSYKAFNWLWTHLEQLPECVSIYHEGRCGRCGRRLTVPESIKSGFGPECITMIN